MLVHFYVFTYREDSDIPFYERTCGNIKDANRWIKEYKDKYGYKGFISVDSTPKKFWY